MKKIVVVLTNVDHFEKDGEKTGLWLSEATEFVNEVKKAGYDVDYVSPCGGEVPIDPRSMEEKYTKESDLNIYHSNDFRTRALLHTMRPEDIRAEDYLAIYYTGGHGAMWDFPNQIRLQEIADSIYESGGYVTSVCHGIAGLFNIRTKNGGYLISGKEITGFTDKEELLSGKKGKVPFSNEKEARIRGAKFKKKLPFQTFTVSDERVITGQNPMSGSAVAEKLLAELRK